MQCKASTNDGRHHIKQGRMYEWARKEFARYSSERMKIASKGEGNSQFGSRWICNISERVNRKISKNKDIPSGWQFGRSLWPNKYRCRKCNGMFEAPKGRKFCSAACRPTTKGIKFSEEVRMKMSDIKKELYKDPTKNPMYGKRKKRDLDVKAA